MAKKPPQVLRLKVTIEHVEPEPWREIEIRSDKTLPHLHDAIQAAFLWNDMHLWDFQIGARKYEMKDGEFWIEPVLGSPVMEVTTKRLDFFLNATVPRVIHTYDSGDDWEHRVELISNVRLNRMSLCRALPRDNGRRRQKTSGVHRCTRSSRRRVRTQATQNTIGRRKLDMWTGRMMKSTPTLSASSSRNRTNRRHDGLHAGLWKNSTPFWVHSE